MGRVKITRVPWPGSEYAFRSRFRGEVVEFAKRSLFFSFFPSHRTIRRHRRPIRRRTDVQVQGVHAFTRSFVGTILAVSSLNSPRNASRWKNGPPSMERQRVSRGRFRFYFRCPREPSERAAGSSRASERARATNVRTKLSARNRVPDIYAFARTFRVIEFPVDRVVRTIAVGTNSVNRKYRTSTRSEPLASVQLSNNGLPTIYAR